jgi:hypothetical protein
MKPVASGGGNELYPEIRIDNTFIDENGREVSLKSGAQEGVAVEAEPGDTAPKG